MSNLLAVIQARMGSKRLPGKMMKKLGKDYVIDWVIKRVKKSKLIGNLIIATSKSTKDDVFEEICKKNQIGIFRGSELDVLDRFNKASIYYQAQTILRICADNPFIDHLEIDRLISFYQDNKCDYSFNNQNKLLSNYADGFGAEIFSRETLDLICLNCKDKRLREHVTLYIWENLSEFEIKYPQAKKELAYPQFKFDLDTISDFDKLSTLVDNGVNLHSKAADIIKIFLKYQRINLNER